MKKSLLLASSLIFFSLSKLIAQTAASAIWQPASSSNIPGTVATTGSIQADPQGGTMEAFSYSSSVTSITDATGFQRTRSTTDQPQLPYNNAYNPDAYLQYKVSPAAGQYFKVTTAKVTVLGGGTGNLRLVVKYSTDGSNFSNMPVAGAYFLADGTAQSYSATEAQPVVAISTGAAAMTESKRILTFDGLNVILAPGQSFYIRFYPYLIDTALPSSRYLMSRQMVISGLTASNPSVLPLDFLSFNAKLTDGISKQVKLSWSTANEVNTKSFAIERKTSAGFATIGSIASNNTAGTNNYIFTDIAPASGVNYYRIKQIDKDGKSSDSKVVQVENKGSLILSVYPNPTSQTSVSVNHNIGGDNATLKVLSLQGLVAVTQLVAKGSNKTVLDISSLASGYYAVVFENGSEKSTVKLLKQ